jgi:predicted amidohydrolase
MALMSSKCQVSSDPADAFVAIFDKLPDSLFLGDEADKLSAADEVIKQANAVERQVLLDGQVAPGLCDLPDDQTRNRVGFARLIALDRVLRRAHPHAGAPTHGCVIAIAARYAEHGRFNSRVEEDGLLLPRLMEYGAPPHRPDKHEFFGVVRVTPTQMANVEFKRIGLSGCRTHTGYDDVLVACLPFLDMIQDVKLERVVKYGEARYRLGPSDDPRLEARIDDAILALDRSGAPIGLLPEGALSKSLLPLWQQRLLATDATGSNLSLIVAGTGPTTDDDPPYNRAVVLDRDGKELWRQDKLCDFTLARKTIDNWHLHNELGPSDHILYEDITRGEKLLVAETELGRLAILICEDLGRCETRGVEPRDFGVSHILVPVFDCPLNPQRWHTFAAQRLLNWIGTRVVVSCSRVVGNQQGRPGLPKMFTALGLSPNRKNGTWEYARQDPEETDSATQAVPVRLSALGPPPAELKVF